MKKVFYTLLIAVGVSWFYTAFHAHAKHEATDEKGISVNKSETPQTLAEAKQNSEVDQIQRDGEGSEGALDIIEYTVKSGDTLSSIAQDHDIHVATITAENNISEITVLRLGQILRILPIDALYYQVQSGDTLSGIAKKYNLDQDEIIEVNKLDTSDNLFEGQGLFLPGAEKYPKQAESKDTSSTSSPSSISTPASAPTKTQNTGGVTWTEGALNELDKIYLPSARPVVKAKVEAYALEHGISVITKEIYLGIHV